MTAQMGRGDEGKRKNETHREKRCLPGLRVKIVSNGYNASSLNVCRNLVLSYNSK